MADVRASVSPLHVLGGTVQAIAYGILDRHDLNTSYTTRAVGTLITAMLVATGTVMAAFPPFWELAFLIPIVRADLSLLLLARIVRTIVWAGRLTPSNVLYENEVFPLQVAAMIWNDCQPVAPLTRAEDERSALVDLLLDQRELWRPAQPDSFIAQALRFPAYLILEVACFVVGTIEAVVYRLVRMLFGRVRNRTPVPIQGEQREIIGHTLLLTDGQLKWIQGNLIRGGDPAQNREARRVVIRALHVSNLLEHGGFARLCEHSADGHAMSEYYSAIQGNDVVKSLLSKIDALAVLKTLENGNTLRCGNPIPRQVLWARLLVGSFTGLQGQGRWKGPVAAAVFSVAEQNVEQWGASVSRTAMHRHVYSVLRRWLVDWMMYIWWELDVPEAEADDVETLFGRLRQLWTSNLMHNTRSLPHAIGELAMSIPRHPDVDRMLELVLGLDWELWMQQTPVASGVIVAEAVADSGEWQCVGREVVMGDLINSTLYGQTRLSDLIAPNVNATLGDQARGVLAARIVTTLIGRVQDAWLLLPRRLFDVADLDQPNAEY